ncbi:MAG TPA: hypothetical protein VF538_09270 [Pyrinomonadaceae bacterium]|jgi:hypothetical protein
MKTVRSPRTLPLLALLTLLLVLCAHGSRAGVASAAAGGGQQQSEEKYRVFCVNGKVDFGNRSLKDMQWDYGKNVCQLGEFNTYRAAKDDVRKRGGVGADCRCQ